MTDTNTTDSPQWNGKPLPREVKWLGSTYLYVSVADGAVTWHNPVSRYTGKCSVDAWWRHDPYDKANQ